MKRIVFILILVILPFMSFAQNDTIGNFIRMGNKLIWQKVYHFHEQDSEKVHKYFYQNSHFACTNDMGLAYLTLKDYTDTPYGQRPVYFNTPAKTHFVIQIKENRYRVIVQSLEPTDAFVSNNTSKSVEERKYLSNLFEGTAYFKKNGELRQTFITIAPLLDSTLSAVFNYSNNNTIILDDNF